MDTPPTWLVPGESIVRKTASGSLILTTHRIRHDTGEDAARSFRSIPLSSVVSCAVGRRRDRALTTLGFAIPLIALAAGVRDWQIVVGVLLGIGLLVAQFNQGPVLRAPLLRT